MSPVWSCTISLKKFTHSFEEISLVDTLNFIISFANEQQRFTGGEWRPCTNMGPLSCTQLDLPVIHRNQTLLKIERIWLLGISYLPKSGSNLLENRAALKITYRAPRVTHSLKIKKNPLLPQWLRHPCPKKAIPFKTLVQLSQDPDFLESG